MIKQYQRAGVPLVLFETADPAEVVRGALADAVNGSTAAVLVWDCIRGIQAANPEASEIADNLNSGQDPAITTGNPVEALRALQSLPENVIAVMVGLGPILADPQSAIPCQQALWNLRDTFKSLLRTVLIMTAPLGYKLPAGLVNDVVSAVIALPGAADHEQTVLQLCDDMKQSVPEFPAPDSKVIEKAVDAVSGLSGFAAEQSIALSLSKTGIDLDGLWERKRRQIEQTPGLSVWRGGERFGDIGGCDNAKAFFRSLIAGRRAPRCVVFLDEIEKSLAGAGGDTSGVSQGMLGALLTHMQDTQAAGSIFIGPPGAAKSAMAKAIGNEANCPTIAWDLSGTKASLVGESEARTRAILQVVDSVGQGQALFIATCNSIGALPPELRRRFTLGTFFFDLPTADERAAIWGIWRAKYQITDDRIPQDEGWTGAEVRQCCDLADRLSLPLSEAAAFVIPVARSAADQIEALRKTATGKFLSASNPGIYRFETAAKAAGRKMEV